MKQKLLIVLAALLALPAMSWSDDRSLLVVSEMVKVKAAPAKVWEVVRPFDGLSRWHPAFASSTIVKGRDGKVGAIRELSLKDGPTFTEELTAMNEQAMAFSYRIVESPLPVDEYQSTLTVKPDGDGGSVVLWIANFKRKNPRDSVPEGESDMGTEKLLRGAYQGGLQNLRKIAEQ